MIGEETASAVIGLLIPMSMSGFFRLPRSEFFWLKINDGATDLVSAINNKGVIFTTTRRYVATTRELRNVGHLPPDRTQLWAVVRVDAVVGQSERGFTDLPGGHTLPP